MLSCWCAAATDPHFAARTEKVRPCCTALRCCGVILLARFLRGDSILRTRVSRRYLSTWLCVWGCMLCWSHSCVGGRLLASTIRGEGFDLISVWSSLYEVSPSPHYSSLALCFFLYFFGLTTKHLLSIIDLDDFCLLWFFFCTLDIPIYFYYFLTLSCLTLEVSLSTPPLARWKGILWFPRSDCGVLHFDFIFIKY